MEEMAVLEVVVEMAARASQIGEAVEMAATSAAATRMAVPVALVAAAVAVAILQVDGSTLVVLELGPRDLCSAVLVVMEPSTGERAAAALQRLVAHFLRGQEPMYFATVLFREMRPFLAQRAHHLEVVSLLPAAQQGAVPSERQAATSPWTIV